MQAPEDGLTISTRPIDLRAIAHDASHYLLTPEALVVPATTEAVARLFESAIADRRTITFRSGGTSLSGQAVSSGYIVDVRRRFRRIEVFDDGARVRVQPGATLRQVNARLARYGRKLGPDPASEIACTVGGVIANNSSGMVCGIEQNTYRTIESMTVVLPSGTVIDTAGPDADEVLREMEPELHAGLTELRDLVLTNPSLVSEVRRQYAMKNTMGYGVNSLLDFERPVDILAHLMVGSEGTLGFVAEAVFHTVPLHTSVATGLLLFSRLDTAIEAVQALADAGFVAIELLDATALAVAQTLPDRPDEIADLHVGEHAALLVELQAADAKLLTEQTSIANAAIARLTLIREPVLSTDGVARDRLWRMRKGLYPLISGSRPSGTTALLEDIAVPLENLAATCTGLQELFELHGYKNSVIFGHARAGNVHFMVIEDFNAGVDRYRRFTEDMVRLVLGNGGSLKAEHGTGRVMAPFVRQQFGDSLYVVMHRIKQLFDPAGILNPGVLLSDDKESYLRDLKRLPTVDPEIDRCVECGYCEASCPSRDLTLTPRQRIVVRREVIAARMSGDDRLADELEADYEYDGIQTCAVDGMCAIACPVDIDTGDLVRRLRAESQHRIPNTIADAAARAWGPATRSAALALTAAHSAPATLAGVVTKAGRRLLGDDIVPLYDGRLPRGGSHRRPDRPIDPVAVYFPSCVNTMFGPERGAPGVRTAFERLCERAGLTVRVPAHIDGMCCGTPWKSKGYLDGYDRMSRIVLPALFEESDSGRLPILCDASSCTEGLETMRDAAASLGYLSLKFVDVVAFTHDRILDRLPVAEPVDSLVLHHTCSTSALGVNAKLTAIAQHVARRVIVPIDEGCCGFAGDRGMLHPELTASATAAEAAEVNENPAAVYASANRTCEIGMTRATGQPYVHILEILEQVTQEGT